jgi:lipoate-protein ligase A
MAIDEILLESAIKAESATLRLYTWKEPTVSLGYFQSAEDPVLDERFPGLARVRRLSGGGAILHDRELTYSIAFPPSHEFGSNPGALYDRVHAGIVGLLNEWQIPARLRGAAKTGDQPFLCFGRGDQRDIVLGDHKILGSAQRRRRGGILQHGALLLKASSHAPEFPGLFDLATTGVRPIPDLAQLLSERIAHAIVGAGNSSIERLYPDESRASEELAADRYATLRSFINRDR